MPTTLAAVYEQTTPTISGTITDADGDGVPVSALSTATYTVYDERTNAIIRAAANMLSEIDSEGAWSLTLAVSDTTPVSQVASERNHVILVEWTQTNGNVGKDLIVLPITNLPTVE